MEKNTSSFDYNSTAVPDIIRQLKPEVFDEGDGFCVLYGSDLAIGISGCGSTIDEALKDWMDAYNYLIKKDPELKSIWEATNDGKSNWPGWKPETTD